MERFSENEHVFTVEALTNLIWIVTFSMSSDSLYANETHKIYIRFDEEYPLSSPEVKFCLPAPVHPHIYSNGHICLNILYEDWSPALTIKSICLSLISMLSSCTHKVLPNGNASYVSRTSHESNPKKTRFMYDDDTV